MGEKLRFGVACGGTGGHIFPGLATANELADRGHDVTLWLAGKDIEHDAVKAWQGKVVTIPAEGFQFGLSLRSLQTIAKLRKAYRLSLAPMREQAPRVMLAMGSYASYGPIKAATKLGIPYVLHEANLVPGRAVSLLARRADTVAVSFEKTSYYLKHGNIVTTGMPLRKELQLASEKPRKERGANDPLRILVVGGSRGAQALNETVPKAIAAAAEKGLNLQVEHIAGLQDKEAVEAVYAKLGANAHVHQFVQDMENKYRSTDLAISRSGAATCAELAAFGVPALLVPYPHAVRDHQMSNARILQDAKAADVVAQEDLSASWLRDYLVNVSEKPARLERMAVAMKKRGQSDAAARLADLLEKVAGA
ncbi:UDP-N-acetylglucosamine--N-acetylmuramyl-(pentapeptide) pyrophosphoryl-undecaprenol N-acetylglucosamine transferase [Pontiella desulfatans]|uniref:UDP-N-acetylglucosamine--N-acetylmuramyl-(pentapeptide) pyrophosphoryl-undecaprenol N-acetylglucosamine transferase n=1 Tax=Pontiella desulfatans TaxID=2750659 RepID=A0A6C2U4R4_PONDE|nr:undecaprenyldiphospho-muramoylpentapeptide beta-N-acetylglucosaminyltransferase [Pontiella desulfatans]VGO14504.1 UDP-N-acetylglucosamine--N-acetylmuramyl-(pentapeptide) pyrophosphoryl-undecaprenol N-acetylglucosamine transferase [Pontiella desulfatans]